MPCGLCAAVPVVKPTSPCADCDNKHDSKKLIRPSELPLYSNNECAVKVRLEDEYPPSYLEQGFGTVRKTIQGVTSEYFVFTDTLNSKVNTSIAHSQQLIEYLREDSNVMPRLGAIGIGGLAGLIFGLRGGKFKRLVYTSVGALSVGAICYPKQAGESVSIAKHYANIGYNFIYGVKPGDGHQMEITWPELPHFKVPSSLSELKDMTVQTGTAIVSTIGSMISKTDSTESKEDKSEVPESKKK